MLPIGLSVPPGDLAVGSMNAVVIHQVVMVGDIEDVEAQVEGGDVPDVEVLGDLQVQAPCSRRRWSAHSQRPCRAPPLPNTSGSFRQEITLVGTGVDQVSLPGERQAPGRAIRAGGDHAVLGRGVRQDERILRDRHLVERVVLVDVAILTGVRERVRHRRAPFRFLGVRLFGGQQDLRAPGLDAAVADQQRTGQPGRRVAPGLRAVLPEVAVGISVSPA